jgi:ferric-dicitrate binding protein FerR (iron transport regulator)
MNDLPRLLITGALVASMGVGCQRTQRPIAELESLSGNVVRDYARAVGSFVKAAPGAEFSIGDGIRTSERSSAKLRLFDDSRLDLEQRTHVRFKARSGAKPRLELEAGEAVLTASSHELSLDTSFGMAVLAPGTELHLARHGQLVKIEVAIGSAVIEGQGRRDKLTARDTLEVDLGLAQIDAKVSPPPGPVASSTSAGPAPASAAEAPLGSTEELAGAHPGAVELESSAKQRVLKLPGGSIVIEPGSKVRLSTDEAGTQVDVSAGSVQVKGARTERALSSGEASRLERSGQIKDVRQHGFDYHELVSAAADSFVVHDPHPPTIVAFPNPAGCEGRAALHIAGAGPVFVGEGGVSAPFQAGRHRYVLSCLAADGTSVGAETKGVITILADAGSRQLPASAPDTVVDADGRTYTVLYQNRLPRIIARWPKAPAAASYSVQVSSAGRSRALASSAPQQTFEAGSLGEGVHQLTFEGGGRRSRTTSIDIRFDNATPTASIASPADGFSPGAQVSVSGMALPGWSVSVGGNTLVQDAQNRFSGLAPTAGARALAIRFSHPQRGVHYYLRRPGGGA